MPRNILLKNLGYGLLKRYITVGLYLYYGKINIVGLENVPTNGPLLFLPNHQGALMDVLLIVTDCRRKPFFLTRSDVFQRPALKSFFAFLQMLPIYRIRDGRESLKKNQAVFNRCTQLFLENHALVMFPEANHNLKRRVRPLSKGFTRIIYNTMEKMPDSEIHIVPIGMNYRSNIGFPDKVAVYYGTPVSAKGIYHEAYGNAGIQKLRDTVSQRLKTLTTHIENETDYDTTVQKLDALQVDYLNPTKTNAVIADVATATAEKTETPMANVGKLIFKGIFTVLNFPILALWRIWIKPKVWEPEFTSTLRFGFALLVYPLYYLILFIAIAAVLNVGVGFAFILLLFLINWTYVRWC
ncbi:MAG: 1-acyl-sn-glycerol-3-phosphate acyltransferase [Pricia sp.]